MAEITAFVLAGGLSSRFGYNKALSSWNGKPLLEHMLERLKPLFPARRVLTKRPELYETLRMDVPILPDSIEKRHPMAGVLSALMSSRTDWNFVCACDMPLLQINLVADMIEVASGYDAVVSRWHGKIQPLCGLYNKRCMKFIEDLLKEDHAHCANLFDRVKTRFFLEPEVALTDTEGLTFMDVDTPKDFEAAKARET